MFNYTEDFDTFVDITYKVLNGHHIQQPVGYEKTLIRTLREVINQSEGYRIILKEDIIQQLRLLWLTYTEEHKQKQLDVAHKSYLIWRSIYGLKDWLRKELTTFDTLDFDIPSIFTESEQKIDVQFLIKGSKIFPLSLLSSYERYLLFLRFYKEMDITEMASLMNKSRPTMHKQLVQVIEKLRREYEISKERSSRSR